jgi:hypothetical protein
MKIETGKCYRTRDGRKVGPMSNDMCPEFVFDGELEDEFLRWFSDGFYSVSGDHPLDLVAEWTDEPDTPKAWCEITDAEKGALLLAAHQGKAIEFYDPEHPADGWMLQVTSKTGVHRHFAYRIKPEPKRDTVTLYGYVQNNGDGAHFDNCWAPNEANTHRITFDVVDGEPDCSSVRMEEVEQ